MSESQAAWLPFVVAAVVVLIGIAGLLIWRKRRGRVTVHSALKAIAVDRLEDILVPDGMGGEIHIEHLILTTRGILVINIKQYEGVIWASDRMDQWTAMGREGRSTFRNPLPTLYDRVAAVRQVVRDVDVAGYVLFPAHADFSKGRPADVMLPDDLIAGFGKPEQADLARLIEAFEPYWEKIRGAVKPASA